MDSLLRSIYNLFTNENTLVVLTWVGSFGGLSVLFSFLWHNISKIKFTLRLNKELRKEGLNNFFPDAQTYMEYTDHGKPAQYVSGAKKELAYIGFWLSNSIGLGGLTHSIKELLAKGVDVTLVLLNPYDKDVVRFCNMYFSFDQQYIENEFRKACRPLYDFYNSPNLSPIERQKFHLKLHNMPLSTSAYLLDWNDDKYGKILLDNKILGIHFSDGYGLEFFSNSSRKDEGSIYNRLKKSYTAFLDDKNVLIPTINVNLDKGSFEELLLEVNKSTNAIR